MDEMSTFNPDCLAGTVLAALESSGWFRGRVVDVSSKFKILEESGWRRFDLVEDFLISMDGLPSNGIRLLKDGYLIFDCSIGYGSGYLGKYWGKIKNSYIFPIGSYYDKDIYLTSSGMVLATTGEYGFDVYGDNVYEGINNIFSGIMIDSFDFDFDAFDED